ncbi:MAG TPA: efflux RND transporter periplasmic adaptor subunit [Thermoanaerobaculia bacterium]|nr:efflux RND transporter periplasmic adaptor subunit [Thermoanaerobaculia bacterium]
MRRAAVRGRPVHARPASLLLLLFLAKLALFVSACEGGGSSAPVEFLVPVGVEDVATGSVEDRIVATGTLRAAESVVVLAESPGRLQIARTSAGRRLAEGDRVTRDQPIAEITGEDARLAANIDATLQAYRTAEAERDARRKLFEEELISTEEYRRAETALEEARAALERSRLTEERTRLTTPISGVLMELARDASGMPVADGQLVSPGFQVARISPTNTLIADIDLVGPELARVRPGQKARVRHFAWEGRGFVGTVLRLSPSVDPATHTFRAEVAVANEEGLLRPGMFVEVTLLVEQREGVPVVPRAAVTERGGRRVVFVLDGQRVAEREVVLGLGDDEVVEVVRGVSSGDRIVVRGLETLTDGTRVRVSG